MKLNQLPNILTLLRLALIAPFLLFLFQAHYEWAFYIFFMAGVTDGIDGWLARTFQWQSVFGSMIDPLADKLLVASSFVSLALLNKLPWWLVIIVFARDLTISVGILAWYWVVRRPLEFEPTQLSKMNTTLQLALVTLCLFELAFFSFSPIVTELLLYITTITTAISYVDYVWTWSKKAYSSEPPVS